MHTPSSVPSVASPSLPSSRETSSGTPQPMEIRIESADSTIYDVEADSRVPRVQMATIWVDNVESALPPLPEYDTPDVLARSRQICPSMTMMVNIGPNETVEVSLDRLVNSRMISRRCFERTLPDRTDIDVSTSSGLASSPGLHCSNRTWSSMLGTGEGNEFKMAVVNTLRLIDRESKSMQQ